MTYEPNWLDRRVQRRLKKVLDWAALYAVSTRGSVIPIPIHSWQLQQIFGPKGNELGDFLREKLLTLTLNAYSVEEGRCKEYRVKRDGYEFLTKKIEKKERRWNNKQQHAIAFVDTSRKSPLKSTFSPCEIQGNEASPVSRLRALHRAELDTLVFNMNDVSARLWHPLQNIKSSIKREFWAPYLPYNYDISSCAPSILFQLAKKCGISDIRVEELKLYIENKTDLREHIMAVADLSPKKTKRLINSLFNGARLARNRHCSAFHLLDFDWDRMAFLQTDERVTSLRTQIKRCWTQIELGMRAAGGHVRLKTSSEKWKLYFTLERRVLNAIIEHLTANDIKFFTEHDGFRTNRPVDISALETHIRLRTGFSLSIVQD